MFRKSVIFVSCALWSLAAFSQWNIKAGDGKSLEAAFEKIESGSILKIPEGTYQVSQPLSVIDKESVIISGEGKVEIMLNDIQNEVILLENVSHLVLRNIKFRHYLPDSDQVCTGDVVHLVNTQNVIIEKCDLNGCGVVGIGGFGNESLTLRNNFIHNNSYAALHLYDHQGNEEYLLLNSEEDLEGVRMEGNRIENNGNWEQRIESIVGGAKWVEGPGEQQEIYANSEKVKQINKEEAGGLKLYASGKMEGVFAGTEFGDFAHFSIVTNGIQFSFFVFQCPEFETFDSNPELLGRKVSIKWEERDLDLRDFSGMIERSFGITSIKLVE